MKLKIFSLILALLMTLGLFACDTGNEAHSSEEGSTNATESSENDKPSEKEDSEQSSETKKEDSEQSSETTKKENSEAESPGQTQEKVKIKAYLAELLSGYLVSPYSFIPETMLPSSESRLVNPDSIRTDYSDFVKVSSIQRMGMGEQWNMISGNLAQSQVFFTVLSGIDTVTTSSVVVFNNYIDKNPAAVADYSFAEGIYTVTIKCDYDNVYYVLDYEREVPVLGEQVVQIAMSMDIESKVKTVRIQLGELYVLTYTVDKDNYEFAIRYGYEGEIGGIEGTVVRSAYFSLTRREDGTVSGKIYEYITAGADGIGVEVPSAAEFYISDKYVTAIGNKADGMLVFKGYICELYDAESGEMIAYEVQETLSSIEYNTLWFDLDDVSGITSVKFVPETKDAEAMLFVNGSDDAWESKTVGLEDLKKFASRRFDIEFRKQYYCYYDAENEAYVSVAVDVPMLFVQEEVYDDLVSDVKKTNGINISVGIDSADMSKLLADYDALVTVFAEGENAVSSSDIAEIIGERVAFH